MVNRLSCIQNVGDVIDDPYPFVCVEGALPKRLYQELCSTFPEDLILDRVSEQDTGSPTYRYKCAQVLREGDLLLSVDGRTVNRFRDVERAVQGPLAQLVVLRDGTQQALTVETVALYGGDIDRLLIWAGAVIHAPHRAMAAQRGIPSVGVFVAYFSYGSPAARYRLIAGRRIIEVDGVPTPDMDSFIRAVAGRPDRSSLRLKTVTWNGSVEVITLKLDEHYWPAYELRRGNTGWQRHALR